MNDWRDRALCASEDPELFTADHLTEIQVALAQSICDRCPVRRECGEYADRQKANMADLGRYFHGVWAGVWHGPAPKRYPRCKIDGCDKHRAADGMCNMHYKRTRTNGSPYRRLWRAEDLVREWRHLTERGMTAGQVAERLGVTRSALYKALDRMPA